MPSGLVDVLGVFAVPVGQGAEDALAHDVRETEHGVQGRAQFMAHIGKEARLAGLARLGLGAGDLQTQFAGVLGGGVEDLGDQARPRRVVQPPHDQLHPAVQRHARREQGGTVVTLQGAFDGVQKPGPVRRMHRSHQPRLEQGIDRQRDGRRAIGGEDASRRFEHQRQSGLGGQQGLDPRRLGLGRRQPGLPLPP